MRLRSIKPGKKTETDDVTLHFGNLYRIAQLLIGIRSENYDAEYNSMIYSDFLLVLHCYITPITSNIKQCVNDKNRPPAAKITAGGQLVVKKWSMRARYGAAFCLTVSPFHSGSRHNPLLSEFTDISAICQLPIGHSFAQGNSDKEVI